MEKLEISPVGFDTIVDNSPLAIDDTTSTDKTRPIQFIFIELDFVRQRWILFFFVVFFLFFLFYSNPIIYLLQSFYSSKNTVFFSDLCRSYYITFDAPTLFPKRTAHCESPQRARQLFILYMCGCFSSALLLFVLIRSKIVHEHTHASDETMYTITVYIQNKCMWGVWSIQKTPTKLWQKKTKLLLKLGYKPFVTFAVQLAAKHRRKNNTKNTTVAR